MARRTVKKVIGITACAYVGSPLVLSLLGRYEPDGIGTAGVKWYAWAPQGFQTDFKGNTALTRIYYPLVMLDWFLWHGTTTAEANTFYPINYIPLAEIGKVAEAWARHRGYAPTAP